MIRQLEEELRIANMRNPDHDVQQHLDAIYMEKEHMSKEIYLLRETNKVILILIFFSNDFVCSFFSNEKTHTEQSSGQNCY